MAGVFVAQKRIKVAVEDLFEEVDTEVSDGQGGVTTVKVLQKTGVNETWREVGEVVHEAEGWSPSAVDTALSRGDLSYTDAVTVELRERIEALEEAVAQLTNRTKKGS